MADQVRITSGGQAKSALLTTGPTDASGNPVGSSANPTYTQAAQNSYQLANNIASLAAQAGTTPVTGVKGGTYVWDAQFTGTGPLLLQALGSDGASWRTVATLNASGTFAGEVRIGANAQLRVFNSHATVAVTSVYSSLS